ncbi:PREDICTED: uncharacterized protein LOC109234734 [Nicotiana attenuata]|uniref:uncharacterized protein LOC109234734 n=1 Tax=Nicotiana attenuata TaxID=49451 RepID=UPI0009057E04|nr:PREDICTED: uncharacterized protein LOC109234734 [Nicotiana attenuata]
MGADYYIAKFKCEEHMIKVLNAGPWFIFGHFLSIQRWKPNFVATEVKSSLTVIWIRLPQLPTEFYDGIILAKIRNAIGKLLKVDACTSSTLRGRYARLCIELAPEVPVVPFINIGHHKQIIQYEGESTLCKQCGRLGHVAMKCHYVKTSLPTNSISDNINPLPKEVSNVSEVNGKTWQTVKFQKKKRTNGWSSGTNQNPGIPSKLPHPIPDIDNVALPNTPNRNVSDMEAAAPHFNQNQAQAVSPVNNPPTQPANRNVHEHEEPPVENVDEMNLLGSEEIIEFSSLNDVKVYLFREMQEKRYVLSCRPRPCKVLNGYQVSTRSNNGEPCNDTGSIPEEEPTAPYKNGE